MPISNIDRLVKELRLKELAPRVWEMHGRLRVYFKPDLGDITDCKVFFDYETREDQEMAREPYDGTTPISHCTRLKVWHDDITIRRKAWNMTRELALELNRVDEAVPA